MSKISLKNNTLELNEILETIKTLPKNQDKQEKTIELVSNGSYEVTPDEEKILSQVNINTNINNDLVNIIMGRSDITLSSPDILSIPTKFFS